MGNNTHVGDGGREAATGRVSQAGTGEPRTAHGSTPGSSVEGKSARRPGETREEAAKYLQRPRSTGSRGSQRVSRPYATQRKRQSRQPERPASTQRARSFLFPDNINNIVGQVRSHHSTRTSDTRRQVQGVILGIGANTLHSVSFNACRDVSLRCPDSPPSHSDRRKRASHPRGLCWP